MKMEWGKQSAFEIKWFSKGHPPKSSPNLAFFRILTIPTCKKFIDSQAEDDPVPLTIHFTGEHTILPLRFPD